MGVSLGELSNVSFHSWTHFSSLLFVPRLSYHDTSWSSWEKPSVFSDYLFPSCLIWDKGQKIMFDWHTDRTGLPAMLHPHEGVMYKTASQTHTEKVCLIFPHVMLLSTYPLYSFSMWGYDCLGKGLSALISSSFLLSDSRSQTSADWPTNRDGLRALL